MTTDLVKMVLRKSLPIVAGALGAVLASEYTSLFNSFCQGKL